MTGRSMLVAHKDMSRGISVLPALFGKPFPGAFASETAPITFIHHEGMPFV